jgi:hypothetical protein
MLNLSSEESCEEQETIIIHPCLAPGEKETFSDISLKIDDESPLRKISSNKDQF